MAGVVMVELLLLVDILERLIIILVILRFYLMAHFQVLFGCEM
jgi:hypothetical protein